MTTMCDDLVKRNNKTKWRVTFSCATFESENCSGSNQPWFLLFSTVISFFFRHSNLMKLILFYRVLLFRLFSTYFLFLFFLDSKFFFVFIEFLCLFGGVLIEHSVVSSRIPFTSFFHCSLDACSKFYFFFFLFFAGFIIETYVFASRQ